MLSATPLRVADSAKGMEWCRSGCHPRPDARHSAAADADRVGGPLDAPATRQIGQADEPAIAFLSAAAVPTLMPAASAAARML
jgi:hypothetical protein